MSIIQNFVEFSKTLDATAKADVEKALLQLMQRHAQHWDLSPEQEADLKRRLADPNNTIVPHEEVEALLGMKMPS